MLARAEKGNTPMRWLKPILFANLGLFAGCNGCDSCFSKPLPEDVVPTATAPAPSVAPVAPRTTDAALPVERGEDAGGKSDGAAAREEPVVALSAVPRPSNAPMPMGAFQACGVYDGPICHKSCPKGNCRQECDGVECTLACEGGYCSQVCGSQGKCLMTCPGGHCVQVCTKIDGCIRECAGGDCR
ncbi:MAG TPA: hypothetical protein VM580_21505 [Labilithrix sp.]|nr:hypothetical protein [Labilithrix sp.]